MRCFGARWRGRGDIKVLLWWCCRRRAGRPVSAAQPWLRPLGQHHLVTSCRRGGFHACSTGVPIACGFVLAISAIWRYDATALMVLSGG